MAKKEHLTIEGLTKIASIRASINLGLTPIFIESFPNIIPVERPVVDSIEIPDLHWLAGYVEAEGCFFVNITKSKTTTGFAVSLFLTVSQHSSHQGLPYGATFNQIFELW